MTSSIVAPGDLLEGGDTRMFDVQTRAAGPPGALPLTEEMLREWPSGDVFGLSQNAGMGWEPARLRQKEFLILSTQGASGRRTAGRSRWAITPATGRSAC